MSAPIGRKAGRYAIEVGGKHVAPSATTVIGIIDKPALSWGASAEAAAYAVANREALGRLDDAEATNRIRLAFRAAWDRKANIGSLTHAVNEAWVNGAAMGPADVDDFLPKALRGNAGARAALWADASGYVDGLAAFWSDVDPVWVATERCVFNPTPGLTYGGCFDMVVDIAGCRWRLDVKTGSLAKDTGRPYGEVALQLCAYDRAPFMGVYDGAGELVGTEPNEAAERCGVLHLGGDGRWSIFPYVVDDTVWEYFCHARRLYGWLSHAKHVVGDAVALASPSAEAADLAAFDIAVSA